MDYRAYYDQKSKERRRRRKMRLKPRFFVTVGLLAVVIVLIFALFSKPPLYTVGYGALDTVNSGINALVVRDEDIYTIGAYTKVTPHVLEGQDVKKGDAIIDLYETPSINSLEQELKTKRDQIEARLAETLLSRIINQDLDTLNEGIAARGAELAEISKGGQGDAAAVEKALRTLMEQRREYIQHTNVAASDDALNELYSDEAKLLALIEGQKAIYTASRDGRVSMYLDGLEYWLQPDSLSQLTTENDVLEFSSGAIPPGYAEIEANKPLFKIVNPDKWYLVLAVDKGEWTYAQGSQTEIFIDGYDLISAMADVISLRVDEKGGRCVIVTLEINQDIGSMLGKRQATITVGKRIEGYMVPRSAVKQSGGQFGVYKQDGTFVPVVVLQMENYDKNALVLPSVTGELEKGDSIKAR